MLGPRISVEAQLEGVVGPKLSLEVERASTRVTNVVQQLGIAALAACVLVSVLLGAIVHLVQVARVRARATEQAQRDLQGRIHVTRVAAEEVRTLNRTLQERVRERTEGLREAIRDLETFNASVSHDLRSPLGAILNYASVLREDHGDDLGEHGRELLVRVERSARGAVSLMDALLAFSSASREPLSPELTDVHATVESVVEDLRVRSEGKAPEVVVDQLHEAVADPRLLRVFGLFERMHRDTFEGYGIGLAVVKRIVDRHGGRCWAKGVPGRGAAFCFSLPDRRDGGHA